MGVHQTPQRSRVNSSVLTSTKPTEKLPGSKGISQIENITPKKKSVSNEPVSQSRAKEQTKNTEKAAIVSVGKDNHQSVRARQESVSSNQRGREKSISVSRKEADDGKSRSKPRANAALASALFNVNMGPSWDPKAKVPKMEGIDTVVIEGKDGKGRVVKKK